MKKILSGLLISGVLFGGITSVYATDIDGEDSASIVVNGTLGQDNTDEDGPNIDEGSNDWINVTLDTENIFYTTKASDHKTITSPDYTITNNSGRAVKVSAKSFTVDSGNLNNVDALDIKGVDTSTTEKTVNLKSFTAGDFLVLANNQGKLDVEGDAADTYIKETTYKYFGTTKDDYYKSTGEKTTHTLTLEFEALGKDGTPVAP
ncbi:MAG: hypothetical protein ACLTXM_19960 [Enterococcus sp.]